MWRFFAGVGSALLLVTAGFFIWKGAAQSEDGNPVPDAPAESGRRRAPRPAAPAGRPRPTSAPASSAASTAPTATMTAGSRWRS